jgi:hypothetical protein
MAFWKVCEIWIYAIGSQFCVLKSELGSFRHDTIICKVSGYEMEDRALIPGGDRALGPTHHFSPMGIGGKAAGKWNWSLVSVVRRGQEDVKLHLHFPCVIMTWFLSKEQLSLAPLALPPHFLKFCWYSAGLRAGWSAVRVPKGVGNFSLHHHVHTGSWAHPVSYPMGTRGSFPGGKATGAWSWSLTSTWCRGQRMSGAIHPLPQYAFMAWCSVKKSTGTTSLYFNVFYLIWQSVSNVGSIQVTLVGFRYAES